MCECSMNDKPVTVFGLGPSDVAFKLTKNVQKGPGGMDEVLN